MEIKKLTLIEGSLPETLQIIPSPPQQLYCRGTPLEKLLKRPRIAIVGSRGPSTYGKQVTTQLARELAEQGIVIISGLALGVDALAHQAALEAGGLCIAILPGPVNRIYPRSNQYLGKQILKQGGTLISEYDAGGISYKQNFIARNRLIAGLAQAVLITEAGEQSGSLHTARFARKQGKPVLAVPGQITSALSTGSNNLLKSGALAATEAADILKSIGLRPHKTPARQVRGDDSSEQAILDLLLTGITAGDELLNKSHLNISEFNQALTMLEISGKIRSLDASHWSLY